MHIQPFENSSSCELMIEFTKMRWAYCPAQKHSFLKDSGWINSQSMPYVFDRAPSIFAKIPSCIRQSGWKRVWRKTTGGSTNLGEEYLNRQIDMELEATIIGIIVLFEYALSNLHPTIHHESTNGTTACRLFAKKTLFMLLEMKDQLEKHALS